ncbi:MAG: hypothetical protein ABIL20_09315, partial [candidate division WOR-3 bacterium]
LLLRIAEGYHGNNEYEWQIPNTLVSGADYSIEIMDMNNGYRCSSHKFRIVGEKDFAKPSSGYRQASSRWKTTTIDGGNVGYHSSIALDGQNRPHISYYDATNENLKYAYFNGTNWVIQTVDAQGNVGDWTSIAVNKKNGYVHISYCHEDNRDLKYALWNGSSWQIETVDGAGDNRGEYTSITLDSKGNPHISYIMQGRLMVPGTLNVQMMQTMLEDIPQLPLTSLIYPISVTMIIRIDHSIVDYGASMPEILEAAGKQSMSSHIKLVVFIQALMLIRTIVLMFLIRVQATAITLIVQTADG